LLSIELQIPH
jgi:hypothetical protein